MDAKVPLSDFISREWLLTVSGIGLALTSLYAGRILLP